MSELLPCVVVETKESPDAAVIWLHGLGSDGHDFESLVPALSLSSDLAVRFVFPHAPRRPVTVNGGMEMRAWYDIYEMTLERKVDMANVNESCRQIIELIEDQIAQGIKPERIVLAGFSQGGVVAYQAAFEVKESLAGVLALSTYLADVDVIPEAKECKNGQTPILVHHGLQDPIVVPELSEKAKKALLEKGFQVSHQYYDMPHSVCPGQVEDISAWLNDRLA